MESCFVPYAAQQSVPGSRILVLAPHPDDEVFGCGGAIAAHVKNGATISVCILTDGGFIHDGSEQAVSEYADARKIESINAAQLLNYGTPEFWSLKDRGLEYCESLILRILSKLEEYQPDLVYSPSFYEIHPDHRATCMSTIEAVRRYDADIQVALYEVGVPIPRPNFLLDITSHQGLKSESISCFASQLTQNNYGKTILGLNAFRTYTLGEGIDAAEAYEIITSDQIRKEFFSILRPVYYSDRALGASVIGSIDIPLVTVIIRSVHRAKLLREAIQSVQLQTYCSIEVLVVSAAPGPHPEISLEGPFPIRLIDCQSGHRQRSDAGNIGLSNASGEYIMFLDDDDFILPDHISKLVTCLQRSTDSILAYTGIGFVNEEGVIMPGGYTSGFDQNTLIAGNQMPIHAALFRRRVITSGCRMDEALDLLEDWDFWLQVARLGRFERVSGVSGYYRQHDSSGVRTDASAHDRSVDYIYTKWLSRWPENMLRGLIDCLNSESARKAQVELELLALKSSYEHDLSGLKRSQDDLRATIDYQLAHIESQQTEIDSLHAEIEIITSVPAWLRRLKSIYSRLFFRRNNL